MNLMAHVEPTARLRLAHTTKQTHSAEGTLSSRATLVSSHAGAELEWRTHLWREETSHLLRVLFGAHSSECSKWCLGRMLERVCPSIQCRQESTQIQKTR